MQPNSFPDLMQRNSLLKALPVRLQERLAPHLVPLALSHGQVLYEPGEQIEHMYFPTSTLVSFVHTMLNGSSAEVWTVGNDGVVGVALLLGKHSVPYRAVVQVAGGALRVPAETLVEEFGRGGALQRLFLRYTHALTMQICYTAACNRLHSVEQRLCRWLLRLDGVQSGALCVTQEFVATMLGDRRETITLAERQLQGRGLIQHSRGQIRIIDRAGLEALACECYAALRTENAGLRMPPAAL